MPKSSFSSLTPRPMCRAGSDDPCLLAYLTSPFTSPFPMVMQLVLQCLSWHHMRLFRLAVQTPSSAVQATTLMLKPPPPYLHQLRPFGACLRDSVAQPWSWPFLGFSALGFKKAVHPAIAARIPTAPGNAEGLNYHAQAGSPRTGASDEGEHEMSNPS